MEKSRTHFSTYNTITSIIGNIVAILIGFIAQTVFVKVMGKEFLGLNGLFNNVISLLSIADLGLGTSIIYKLYKPIAENNKKEIKSILDFFKSCYLVIAAVVLVVGLLLTFFLNFIIGDVSIDINVHITYILVVFSMVVSYLLAYKRTLIYAYQKNYIINIVHIIYLVILNFFQLLLLYLTKNYYLYLIVKIICVFLENFALTMIANKLYKDVVNLKSEKISIEDKNDIFIKMRGMLCHKLGSFFVNGTDNLIISKFLGLITVGLYSNYYMIIAGVQGLFTQAISSTTASVGNMLVTESNEVSVNVFKKIRFLNFWVATFSGTCLLVIMDSFIKLWLGNDYLLSKLVLFILVFNYFQQTMRTTYGTFKDAAGIFYEDRMVPIVESILNIVFSIVLVKFLGLAGVFLGTLISGIVLWCYSYPKYVYKKVLNRKYEDYAKETIGYILLFIIIASISYYISLKFVISNLFLSFVVNCLIAFIVPNIILIIVFRKTDNFQYYKSMILNKLKKD
jgi:O-antigen/teichoic acid export membrane protein